MVNEPKPEFQRARNEAQRETRRAVILNAAKELLKTTPVSEISLRELSRHVGLSKTNVVRYFETREAVFFALLNQEFEEWLDVVDVAFRERFPEGAAGVEPFAHAFAEAIGRQPNICKLWSALGGELERNISPDAVRIFKLEHSKCQARLAEIIVSSLPGLSIGNAREFVSITIVMVAGLWPFANPAESVREALRHPDLAHARVDFVERLSRFLIVAGKGISHPTGR
ncbi:TetR family transcriptional regulator [Rhizobium sp. RM]|uniref:TetR/AcrR family transcriptional regulator n=1 Tax=Rhizobium sp. RM TaxID=2748079 RepID=UPI00110E6360|nr:TetR family transcriptional regulator [Rhizobium sp. RM]NWJ26053.1 TetR/AcrR family transcriptional regulator [Rhizobium sp. RM]TMV20831.1 TetR/AcrR family transcriptional regulator [Rhizobium sp. Td3]